MANPATIRDLTDPFGGLIRERSFVPGDLVSRLEREVKRVSSLTRALDIAIAVAAGAKAAPEHLLGPGEGVDVDQRSDVYSLGIILYEMLAFHPFSRSRTSLELPDVAALAQHQLFTPPIPLPEIAPWVPTYVWQLVEKSIQKDREYRHDSMQEFEIEARQAQRWYVEEQQCARAERIPVTPREFAVSSAPPVERPKAPVTRDRLLIAAPLVGGVLALAVLSGIRGYKARNAPLERAFSSPGVALAGQRFAARVSIDPKRTGELQKRRANTARAPSTIDPPKSQFPSTDCRRRDSR